MKKGEGKLPPHLFKYCFKKGHPSSNKGKKFSEETRKKMSEARKKITGWKHRLETRRKMSKSQRGKNHWNWQGGISEIKQQIRKILKYRQWRSDIFTKDNFTCVLCGQRGGKLEADHYPKMFSQIIWEYKIKSLEEAENCEELWNINNGRTLCKKCHKLYGKNNTNFYVRQNKL